MIDTPFRSDKRFFLVDLVIPQEAIGQFIKGDFIKLDVWHFALGDLYANGQGVEKNTAIALGWYISASSKGHPQAQETLTNVITGEDKLARSTFQLLLKTDWSILGDSMEVSVDKANTRRGPAKTYKIVTTLERGHTVIPLKQENGWTYIGITGEGKTAWIFSSLISKPAGIYPLD